MILTQVLPHLYSIQLGVVRAFLIDTDELTLVDTGMPGSAEKITNAVRELGRNPSEIRHILVTHCHPDHAGSLAMLKSLTGALAYMHSDGYIMEIIPDLIELGLDILNPQFNCHNLKELANLVRGKIGRAHV